MLTAASTTSIMEAQGWESIWFPELPHHIIQNVYFSTTTKIRDMKRNRKVWSIHRKKKIKRNSSWGSPDVGFTRQSLLIILYYKVFKEAKGKHKELNENRRTMCHQIENINEQIEIILKDSDRNFGVEK